MYPTLRGLARAPLALLLCLAVGLTVVPGAASATTADPAAQRAADRPGPRFTRAQAQDVLARAQHRLRRDDARLQAHRTVGHGADTEITMTLRDLFLARTALPAAQRRTADAILARPSDSGGDDLGFTTVSYGSTPRKHYCPPGGVACVHWVTSGTEQLKRPADDDGDGVPDYVETVAAVVQQVWDHETGTLGYRSPLADNGTATDADNPDRRIDIYLAELGDRGLYGYCAPEGSIFRRQLPGYCVLDNDYADFGASDWRNPLRVTVAHELFHAVQFAYDVDEDPWFMEGTATWMEDQVYDSINDNYQYLAASPIRYPRSSADYTPGFHRYGAFLFFTYASERLGVGVVRRAWDLAASESRYSIQALRTAVSERTSWAPYFALFASWNTLPPGSYSERAAYPAPVYLATKVLSGSSPSTGWRKVALRHLTSASVKVSPNARLATSRRLVIEVDGPNTTHGTVALVQRRLRSGGVTQTALPLSSAGNGRTTISFDRRVVSSVVVVVANSSTAMTACGTIGTSEGPTYSCAGRGVYDRSQYFLVRAHLR